MKTKTTRLTSTERTSFKRCPQQWFWAFRQGLISPISSKALWFGIGMHMALAHYYGLGYKRNLDFVDVWDAYVANDEFSTQIAIDYPDEEFYRLAFLGETLLKEYHKTYVGDNNWDVISTEQAFAMPIPDTEAVYTSTFDGVYRDKSDGLIKLMEHKTATAIKTDYLDLDDQAGGYWAVAQFVLRMNGVLAKDENIDGIMYNFIRKALPDIRPQNDEGLYLNKNGTVSKQQPSPLFRREFIERTPYEVGTQFNRIKDEIAHMDAVRNKQLPVVKRPTKDCPMDCQFFQLCKIHESGGDWREYRDEVFKSQDPYSRYRKAAL